MNSDSSFPELLYVCCANAHVVSGSGDEVGRHEIADWQRGDVASPHLVACAHGLTRNGRDFDVLARARVARAGGAMTRRGPNARLVEFEGVGHAPMFVASDQGEIVVSFLLD